MIEHQRRMGFQKIESFFSDVFSCGVGGCSIPSPASSVDGGRRSYASLRPIPSVPHEFHLCDLDEFPTRNGNSEQYSPGNFPGGGNDKENRSYKDENLKRPQKMIACDSEDEDSVLNETGTTHPDTSFLNESGYSFSSSIALHDESRITRVPMQPIVQEPPMNLCLAEPKVIMVPSENITGKKGCPALLPIRVRAKKMPKLQMVPKLPNVLPPAPPQSQMEEDDDSLLPLPVRPPKIKRLTLDDALSMGISPLEDGHEEPLLPPTSSPQQRLRYHPPGHNQASTLANSRAALARGHTTGDAASGVPPISESIYRSRSLDFLFSSKKHRRRDGTNHHKRGREHPRGSGHLPQASAGRIPAHRRRHDRDEEERTRQQLLEMLSDLNETYATL